MANYYPPLFLSALLLTLPTLNIACDDHEDNLNDNEWRKAQNKGGKVQIVPTGETFRGRSYDELTGAWSNWLQKEPPETNPAFDEDGSFCHLNQSGPFWFLAGTFIGEGVAERTCVIPPGKAIFFPIFASISAQDFLDSCVDLPEEIDRVRCDVNDDISIAPSDEDEDREKRSVRLELTIDGEPIPDLFAYRVDSQPGGFAFESGPLFEAFGIPPETHFPAVADGYWILLKPLSGGVHTLSFSADGVPIDEKPDGEPDLGANYTLIVAGGGND